MEKYLGTMTDLTISFTTVFIVIAFNQEYNYKYFNQQLKAEYCINILIST